jgi:hypothetical protein
MKLRQLFYTLLAGTVLLASCEKVAELPFYSTGKDPVLTSSTATVAAIPADSLKTALVLNWSNPEYATDTTNMKYIIQVDSSGRNFSRPVTTEVLGQRTFSFTARDLNNILLGYGFEFNKAYDIDVRVMSSYANNNERRFSNVLKIRATPYKIPPRVQLPASGKLFIVGDATQGGWSNPVPVPSQELHRIDETTFGGIFRLNGGKKYLILPENGKWDQKYSVPNNSLPGLAEGGDFNFNASDDFPGPAADGFYRIILDFQSGKFTVTPFTQQHDLPGELFIVGGATPGGWSNPVPVPSQQFTRMNAVVFEIPSLNLKTGEKFLLLPENGNWGKKFGEGDKSGFFVPEGADIPAPNATADYKITVNFLDNSINYTKL